MQLELIVLSQIAVLALANPFHKYPFVFLLDVGNEELEKTNSEQIRLSVPGGSLALRYPAVGDGDTIAHVRVSGIDFGTELKASIYDGGPGYKYVVLVFVSNPGVPFDAVVTVQTLPSDYYSKNAMQVNVNNLNIGKVDTNDVSDDDPNDSSEDTSDDSEESISNGKAESELTQPSSNIYQHAQSNDNQGSDLHDESENSESDQYIHKGHVETPEQVYGNENENYIESSEEQAHENDNSNSIEVVANENRKHSDENDETADDSVPNMEPVAQKYISRDVNVNNYNDNGEKSENDESDSLSADENRTLETEEKQIRVDSNLYEKYKALMPHLYGSNIEVYPQQTYEMQEQSNGVVYSDDDQGEIDQMFNDEEIHNDAAKFRDSNNNNNYDSEDSNAVAY